MSCHVPSVTCLMVRTRMGGTCVTCVTCVACAAMTWRKGVGLIGKCVVTSVSSFAPHLDKRGGGGSNPQSVPIPGGGGVPTCCGSDCLVPDLEKPKIVDGHLEHCLSMHDLHTSLMGRLATFDCLRSSFTSVRLPLRRFARCCRCSTTETVPLGHKSSPPFFQQVLDWASLITGWQVILCIPGGIWIGTQRGRRGQPSAIPTL